MPTKIFTNTTYSSTIRKQKTFNAGTEMPPRIAGSLDPNKNHENDAASLDAVFYEDKQQATL